MSPRELEDALRNLRRLGTLLHRDATREVWRVDLCGRCRLVHFHRRSTAGARGLALRHFSNLQLLQKAGIAAPRAVAHLVGYRLDNDVGDAVLLDASEDAIPLAELDATRWRDGAFHRRMVEQFIILLRRLGESKLGHASLDRTTLGIRDDALFVLDPMPLHRGGLSMRDLYALHQAFRDVATRTDVLRVWRIVAPGSRLPVRNPMVLDNARMLARSARRGTAPFARFDDAGWTVTFAGQSPCPGEWSMASRRAVSEDAMRDAWRDLRARLEAGQLEVLKDDRSGMILAGEMVLAGRPLPVIVKRPRRRSWRVLVEFGSLAKAVRTWIKSWTAVGLDVACERPILLATRTSLGFVRDACLVCERVPGVVLAEYDLSALGRGRRRRDLLHRCGAALRRMNVAGFENYDAKSYNWIVYVGRNQSATPVMIDLDGIRSYRWYDFGLKRLVRSLRQHRACDKEDLVHLARGYAPFATTARIGALCGLEAGEVTRIERGQS